MFITSTRRFTLSYAVQWATIERRQHHFERFECVLLLWVFHVPVPFPKLYKIENAHLFDFEPFFFVSGLIDFCREKKYEELIFFFQYLGFGKGFFSEHSISWKKYTELIEIRIYSFQWAPEFRKRKIVPKKNLKLAEFRIDYDTYIP